MSFRVSFSQPSQVPLKGALVLGIYEDMVFTPALEAWDKKASGYIKHALSHTKFKGKSGSSAMLTAPDNFNFSRILVLGLGKEEDFTAKKAEELGGAIVASLSSTSDHEAVCEFDSVPGMGQSDFAAHVGYGAALRSWRFLKYFTKKTEDELPQLQKLTVATSEEKEATKKYSALEKILEAVNLTREVVAEPANVIYPESLAQVAKTLEKDGVDVQILNKKDMEKLGFGALLGVAQGSANEPRMVVLKWNGGKKGEAPVAFIGKGVTFDTGGISIKPSAGMEEMKCDMAGSAAVMGTLKALASRKAKVNAVGVMGLVENMPSGTAQRPGDVVKSYSGQTIEVINTDAEGRLVLADVLWYAQEQFKPKAIIDLATLTGAMVVSLGHHRAGLFSNDQAMVDTLRAAGDASGELLWHMPLDDAYYKDIESPIADMQNVGAGRSAGSISAAKFLQRFIKEATPWAHLDIAGTAWAEKDQPLSAKGANGFGVRLLNEWVAMYHEENNGRGTEVRLYSMTDVGFYHLTRSSLEQALPRLLEKILDTQKRAIIYGVTEERIDSLNTTLWTYGRGSFIPHGTHNEGNAEDQPVWLTTQDENPNGATFLLVIESQTLPNLDPYERCLILFDGNDEVAVKDARTTWKILKDKGHALTYWAQDKDGRWEKAA